MGFLDLVSWLFDPPPAADVSVTARHRELAAAARSERLTPERLVRSGEETREPLVSYLDEDEQPHYVLRGTRLVVVDGEDTQARKHPTRLLVVLVSDERVLYVIGGRLADDVFEVPLADVTAAYLDEDEPRRHVIVEADRDGDSMTFYADVSLESRSDVVDGVAYVQSRE